MSTRRPLTDKHGEVRELTVEDMRHFGRGDKFLPASLRAKTGVRGPQKAPTKIQTSIRLSPQVIETFSNGIGCSNSSKVIATC
ncbi:BrnA antitoxin family protein [Mycetohabitans rhizoxinica]|uniref:BrnA antitoxin family protein n=1 Tax=Mycetohabitans rhizoxinica TaxID=412963 RepID=A0ABZ2PZG5_9BURK